MYGEFGDGGEFFEFIDILGVLNSETEKTKEYSERLMLALIKALERLGDKTAFDYLLNIEYLNYSETVKQAAKDAIGELKW